MGTERLVIALLCRYRLTRSIVLLSKQWPLEHSFSVYRLYRGTRYHCARSVKKNLGVTVRRASTGTSTSSCTVCPEEGRLVSLCTVYPQKHSTTAHRITVAVSDPPPPPKRLITNLDLSNECRSGDDTPVQREGTRGHIYHPSVHKPPTPLPLLPTAHPHPTHLLETASRVLARKKRR